MVVDCLGDRGFVIDFEEIKANKTQQKSYAIPNRYVKAFREVYDGKSVTSNECFVGTTIILVGWNFKFKCTICISVPALIWKTVAFVHAERCSDCLSASIFPDVFVAVEGPEGGASRAELGRINISTIFDIEQQSGTASPKIENYWELSLGAEGRFTLFNKRFHKCRLCPEPRYFMEWNCMLKAEHWDQEVSQLLPQIEQLVLQEYLIFQRSPNLIEQRALIGISTLSTTLGTQFLEWPIESSYYF